jgi:hypothetical protein
MGIWDWQSFLNYYLPHGHYQIGGNTMAASLVQQLTDVATTTGNDIQAAADLADQLGVDQSLKDAIQQCQVDLDPILSQSGILQPPAKPDEPVTK